MVATAWLIGAAVVRLAGGAELIRCWSAAGTARLAAGLTTGSGAISGLVHPVGQRKNFLPSAANEAAPAWPSARSGRMPWRRLRPGWCWPGLSRAGP